MAKVTVMPSMAIIRGFKGALDFYYWMGIACCRSWPKSPGKIRSVPVAAQWPAFSESARLWSQLSLEVQQPYNRLAEGTGLSGRDMFTRSYLSGLYRYPTP
ncbi:hypothetical protein LCGC14_2183940 [marine sediment metagenome]|uniref:Uncharacterized protein n=1 Tax=marine sediment metagenome TaxID=412755 RepID=A0A0F9DLK4_9ZZZZ